MEFVPFPKLSRLSRDVVVTEKLDGTNAQIMIDDVTLLDPEFVLAEKDGLGIMAGSRTRWIKPGADNFGFAGWVATNANELFDLGTGSHFGEWYGAGIQRNYGLAEKRFALFNTQRWTEERPACCDVVPVMYSGEFDTARIDVALRELHESGSVMVPGFMQPEGVVAFHMGSRTLFKKTLDNNDEHKWLTEQLGQQP